MQFALMDRRLFVTMKKLDGVFNGEDMVGLLRVHFVEDGGESGRLAGTRWTRHKHDAVAQIHDFLQSFRQMQILESGDFVGDDAHYNGTAPALLENIHAEARDTGYAVGKVR